MRLIVRFRVYQNHTGKFWPRWWNKGIPSWEVEKGAQLQLGEEFRILLRIAKLHWRKHLSLLYSFRVIRSSIAASHHSWLHLMTEVSCYVDACKLGDFRSLKVIFDNVKYMLPAYIFWNGDCSVCLSWYSSVKMFCLRYFKITSSF